VESTAIITNLYRRRIDRLIQLRSISIIRTRLSISSDILSIDRESYEKKRGKNERNRDRSDIGIETGFLASRVLKDVRARRVPRDENPCDVTERPLSAQVGCLNPRLSTEYTDTWRGSRGRVRCIWTGRANPIIYSSLFDLPIDRYFRAKTPATVARRARVRPHSRGTLMVENIVSSSAAPRAAGSSRFREGRSLLIA